MLLNKERAYRIMDQYGLEALIATSPANVAYTSGYSGYCAILPRDDARPDFNNFHPELSEDAQRP